MIDKSALLPDLNVVFTRQIVGFQRKILGSPSSISIGFKPSSPFFASMDTCLGNKPTPDDVGKDVYFLIDPKSEPSELRALRFSLNKTLMEKYLAAAE